MFSPLNEMSNDEIFDRFADNTKSGDKAKNAALLADYAMMMRDAEWPNPGPVSEDASQQDNRRASMLLFKWLEIIEKEQDEVEPEHKLSQTTKHYWLAVGKYFAEQKRFSELEGLIKAVGSDQIRASNRMYYEMHKKFTSTEPFDYDEFARFFGKVIPLPSKERFLQLLKENSEKNAREAAALQATLPPTPLKADLTIIQPLADWYVNRSLWIKASAAAVGIALVVSDWFKKDK